MNFTIGQFNDSFPPAVDGVANTLINYCDILNKHEKKCYGIVPSYPGKNSFYDFPILNFKSIPVPFRKEYRFSIPKTNLILSNRLNKIDFDILHAHSPFSSGRIALKLAKHKNIPLVATFHSKYKDDIAGIIKSSGVVDLMIENIVGFYNKCDEVWVVNKSTGDTLREYGYKKNFYVMNNGCDFNAQDCSFETLDYVNNKFNILPNEKLILFVGQHIFQKNVKLIIESIRELKKTNLNFKMLFVGDGVNKKDMEKMVDKSNLSNDVIFTGKILDRECLHKIFQRADLFLFPSIYDNAPIVVKEAAASYTPSLLIQGTNAAEGVKDKYNGFLVNKPCEYEISKKIIDIFSDKDNIDFVSKKASQTLCPSWKSVVDMASERYKTIIADYKKNHGMIN